MRLKPEPNIGTPLGLIGGLGVGATIFYYRQLVKAHKLRGRVANLIITHADVDGVLRYVEANDPAGLARYLLKFIRQLSAAGAQITAITGIAPHICAPHLLQLSPLPLVNTVEEIEKCIHDQGLRRVAIFGTRYVTETQLFGQLSRVQVVTPQQDEIELIHQIYMRVVNDAGQNARASTQPEQNCQTTLCS